MAHYFRQDFLKTDDGASLYFQVQGQGEPGLVFNDGLGCDGFAWKYLLPELRERHRILRWHYRGHGKSSLPKDPERIGMLYTCEDLVRTMDAAELPRAVIFGHSMGVQVALEFHRRHPERVLGLVLLCGSYGNPLDTVHESTVVRTAFPFLQAAVERFPNVARRAAKAFFKTELAIEMTLRTELNPELMKRRDLIPYFDHLAAMEPVAFVRTLDSLKDHSAWDHLPAVDVPTLIMAGERDRFTPAWLSHRMAESIPGAELTLIPGGSHTAPLEQPGLFSQRIDQFFKERIFPSLQPASRSA